MAWGTHSLVEPPAQPERKRTHPLHEERDAEEVDLLLVNEDVDCCLCQCISIEVT